jgi:uncharacterized protein with NRDE domain
LYLCLILLAINSHPQYSLIVGSNRDEFYDRSAEPASFWANSPTLLAGRDLRAGGTWLGITTDGKFATITNFRDPTTLKNNAPSRGKLVTAYLEGRENPEQYIRNLGESKDEYNGFNLILGDHRRLFYYSNRGEKVHSLSHGIFGLSNHLLDTPWPKLHRGKEEFKRIILRGKVVVPDDLFHILQDSALPDDESLPNTGVGLEKERMLAPVFIKSPDYGTRSTTLVFIDKFSHVTFIERTHNTINDLYSDVKFEFQVSS